MLIEGKFFEAEFEEKIKLSDLIQDLEESNNGDGLVLQESSKFGEESEKGKRERPVRLINEGWSLNKRYFSKTAVESVAKLANIRSMNLKNHPSDGEDIDKWASSITKSWSQESDGKTGAYAWTYIFKSQDDLLEKVDTFPDQVGLSIRGKGKFSKGEAEGIKGPIVEDVLELKTTDWVLFPAAGGKALGTIKEDVNPENAPLEDPTQKEDPIEEVDKMLTLKEFVEFLESNEGEFKEMEYYDTFTLFLKTLKSIIDSTDLTDKKKLSILKDSFSYIKSESVENEKVIKEKEVEEEMEISTMKEMVEMFPAFAEEFKALVLKESADSEEQKAKELETQNKIQESENKVKELESEVEKYHVKESLQARSEFVNKALTESSLNEKNSVEVPDSFRQRLIETSGDNAEENISKMISEWETYVSNLKSGTANHGSAPEPDKDLSKDGNVVEMDKLGKMAEALR